MCLCGGDNRQPPLSTSKECRNCRGDGGNNKIKRTARAYRVTSAQECIATPCFAQATTKKWRLPLLYNVEDTTGIVLASRKKIERQLCLVFFSLFLTGSREAVTSHFAANCFSWLQVGQGLSSSLFKTNTTQPNLWPTLQVPFWLFFVHRKG